VADVADVVSAGRVLQAVNPNLPVLAQGPRRSCGLPIMGTSKRLPMPAGPSLRSTKKLRKMQEQRLAALQEGEEIAKPLRQANPHAIVIKARHNV
jgi:hypothetical protein